MSEQVRAEFRARAGAQLAERAYVKAIEVLRDRRLEGDSRLFALGAAMLRIEPALIELAGERAEALEAILDRISIQWWEGR